MDKNSVCQLYKYDHEMYFLTKDTPENFAVDFRSHTEDSDYVSWLNFHDLSNKMAIETLCNNLEIDRLTYDDINSPQKRPKLEEYDNYIFFTVKSAVPAENNTFLMHQEQISFILGQNYLISFQTKSSDHFTEVRGRIEHKRGKIRMKGPDFLLFRMLEAIVDNYFEVLESITSMIESIEVQLRRSDEKGSLKLIEFEKRRLIELRKIALPLKDIAFQLEKVQSVFLDQDNHPYFADLKEQCLSVLEEIDANKQILDGMTNLYYAIQGQKMNEIMRSLTVMSSYFIPLTFVVGVYGMNFNNMPELRTKYGYFALLGVMALIAIVVRIYFIRRGWTKNSKKKRPE
ncbi:MAG: magnesium/cobalt transporter CorA [Flavobacteriia bacterium]|jgi:magnesium transporter|nr:magnesium/cobalt transporter CorA [Cryomorphaceae bacterium]